MRKQSHEFLRRILSIPSPSGFEAEAQRAFLDYVGPFADEVKTDVHGNAIGVLNPKGSVRVMLAGHADQVGLMVRYISDNGFLYFDQIGGLDPMLLPGQRVVVHTPSGARKGVIGRKPIHLMETEDRNKIPKMREMWIDIGAENKKNAQKLVSVGDPVTFDVAVCELAGGNTISAGFDDKAGVFVIAEALRLLAARRVKAAVYAVATVQEEVGLRGARTSCFGIDPQVGIAVDVTFASDQPEVEKKAVGDIRLGAGPVIEKGPNFNPVLVERLISAAKRKKIPHQIGAAARPPGTDANAMQISRAGVATALVSVPNRYMHTVVEMVRLSDMEHCAQLIAETVAGLDKDVDFDPIRTFKKKA